MQRFKRNGILRCISLCVATFVALIAGQAQAEYFGLLNGRLGNFNTTTPLSVELGYVQGKFAGADYDSPALRANYLFKENIQLYADLSKTSVGTATKLALV